MHMLHLEFIPARNFHFDQMRWESHYPSHNCCLVLSHIQLFATLWTIACQPPLSMRFPRQEDWSGLPCPPPADLPNTGIEPESITSPALAGGFFTAEPPVKPPLTILCTF